MPLYPATLAQARARQSAKLRELGIALVNAGILSLDQQAAALGLCRSTTWTILKGSHKGSGLSAVTIGRMLSAPDLPAPVRTVILEYAAEKGSGLYGHTKAQRHRFSAVIAYSNRKDQLPKLADVAVGYEAILSSRPGAFAGN